MNTPKYQSGDRVNVKSENLTCSNATVQDGKYFESQDIDSMLFSTTVRIKAGWYYRLAGEFVVVHEECLYPYNPPKLADDEFLTEFKNLIGWQDQTEKPAQIDGEKA